MITLVISNCVRPPFSQVLEAAPGAATSRTTGAEDKGEEPAEEDGEGEEEEEEEEKHSQEKSDMVVSVSCFLLKLRRFCFVAFCFFF